jgi:hypothetical protein
MHAPSSTMHAPMHVTMHDPAEPCMLPSSTMHAPILAPYSFSCSNMYAAMQYHTCCQAVTGMTPCCAGETTVTAVSYECKMFKKLVPEEHHEETGGRTKGSG